jgi:hypothetical protein
MINKWWETDVARIINETDTFYNRLVKVHPHKNKLALTKSKIIECRRWGPTTKLYDANFEQILTQMGIFYVPSRITPGPSIIFPIRDVGGTYPTAQTYPMEGSVLSGKLKSKYHFIGVELVGPRWLGNDYTTIKRIVDLRKVVIVEGSFDLLAAKLLCPDLPILSPLTKKLGGDHITYLRMLGVRDIFLMYDNEEAWNGGKDGAGNLSMQQQKEDIKTMVVTPLLCPKDDPSECLTHMAYAEKLRGRLRSGF